MAGVRLESHFVSVRNCRDAGAGAGGQRIATELDSIEVQVTATNDHETLVESNLERALDLASDCHEAYRGAPPLIKRRFNQIFFEKLYIEDDSHVRSQLAAPFDILLSDEMGTCMAGESKSRPVVSLSTNGGPPPTGRLLTEANKTLRALKALSVKELKMVAGAGFEPATSGL